MLISVGQAQIFFLVFTRIMMMLIPIPVLGGQSVPVQVRIGLGLILAAILVPWTPVPLVTEPLPLLGYASAVLREVIIGALGGFAAVLTFGVIQIAGETMGLGSGFGAGRILNPALGDSGSPMDQLFIMVGLLLFVVLDGHHVFIQAVQRSFTILPANSPLPFKEAGTLISMTAQLFAACIQMALPVMGALLLADITLGLLSRVAPQVQVFFLGLPLKIGLGMVALSMTFAIAFPVMGDLFRNIGTRMLVLISR
jgi:flagellar biosynthetic protein FliR